MIRYAIVLLVLLVPPRFVTAATVTEVHYVMGTYLRISAQHDDAESARRAMRGCFAMARRFDERFSRFDPASELSRLNDTRATVVSVSAEMAELLRRAIDLRAATGGTFDVGVGALTALWRDAPEWPAPHYIEAARATSEIEGLALNGASLVRRPGVIVDLDGIAKGWTVDRCVAHLRGAGIAHALVSFGESSLYALGTAPGGRRWQVDVRGLDPDTVLGTLGLRNEALSVSAVFGHERQIGGRHIGHIINPRSGQPLTQAAVAVIVASSATDAEAFSKALLIRDDTRGLPISAAGRKPVPPAAPASCRRSAAEISGALLIRPSGIRRVGWVAFRPFAAARQIAAAVEPLR